MTHRLVALVLLQALIFGIGMRYVGGQGGVPKLIGWTLVIASLMTLFGFALAIWRAR